MTYPVLADAKTFLSVSSSGEDTVLGWLVSAAVKFVEEYTGHDFVADAAQTVTVIPEYPNLHGKRRLLIRETEFTAGTTVTNGGGIGGGAGNRSEGGRGGEGGGS